jgi:hypothetical protein
LREIADDAMRKESRDMEALQYGGVMEIVDLQEFIAIAGAVPVPLSKFGAGLPQGIGSARVFALRANTSFKTERHPNSLQRVLPLEGDGKIIVKDCHVVKRILFS